MTKEEIKATAGILIIAGSETTATLLSGATYLLLVNPACLARVVKEVRSVFVKGSDFNFTSVTAKLPYLNACLEETLRLYPPVPTVLPRRTGPEGDVINGRVIPPDVCNPGILITRTKLMQSLIQDVGWCSSLEHVSVCCKLSRA